MINAATQRSMINAAHSATESEQKRPGAQGKIWKPKPKNGNPKKRRPKKNNLQQDKTVRQKKLNQKKPNWKKKETGNSSLPNQKEEIAENGQNSLPRKRPGVVKLTKKAEKEAKIQEEMVNELLEHWDEDQWGMSPDQQQIVDATRIPDIFLKQGRTIWLLDKTGSTALE